MSNYSSIIKLLNSANIKYDEISHCVSTRCEHSKQLRASAWLIWIWSKNIVFHCKWNYFLVTTLWDKLIKARNFRYDFGSKDIRFASQEEIDRLIFSKIWSIPPFWFANTDLPIFVDNEIFDHDYFIFNPCCPDKSVRVNTVDLKKIYKYLCNPIKYFTHNDNEFKVFLDQL